MPTRCTPVEHPVVHAVALALATGVGVVLWGGVPHLAPPVPELHPWVPLAALVWWCLRADQLCTALRRWRHWHRLRTDALTVSEMLRLTPPEAFLLGSGFPWRPAETAALRAWRRRYGMLPETADPRGGTPALHGVGALTETVVALPNSDLRAHLAIQGATQSGKTALLRVLLSSAIWRTSGAVVVIDPKGGGDLVAHAMVEAHWAQRPFALICPYFPRLSVAFDPLSTCLSPLEVKERLRALMPPTKEPFFVDKPLAAVQRTAAMMLALGEPWTLPALHTQTLWPEPRCALAGRYLVSLGAVGVSSGTPPPTPAHLRAAYAALGRPDTLAEAVLHDLDAPLQWYEQVTNNLDTALSGLVDTDYTPLLVARPALSWSEIDQERMVVVVLTAPLLLREGGTKCGRLLLQDFMGYLGQRYLLSSASHERPITLLVDETSEVVYEDFIQQVNKGGEAGAQFMLAWQSQADLEARLGTARARELLDNLQTRIWLRIADLATAREVSEGLDSCEIERHAETRMLDYGGTRGMGSRTSQMRTDEDVPLIAPGWLAMLPQGEGFVRLRGALYKLRVPLLPPPDEALVERLGYGMVIRTLRRVGEENGH